MKKNISKKQLNADKEKIAFTGERMIPELNGGKTFYYEHLLRYLFSSQFIKNKRVMDTGCGSGYGSRILYALGAKKVHGVDISEETIKYAKATYGNYNVKFSITDVEKLRDQKKKFDTIVAFEILEHLSDQRSFLRGVKSNLSSDGIFLVSTPNKYTYPSGNLFHVNELFPDQFKNLLKEHFIYVYLFNQQFLFSNSLQPLKRRSDLDLSFIHEKYTKENRISINPNINLKESRYLIAVCSDKAITNIASYSLDTFKVDEFSLTDGIEGMSKNIINNMKAYIENDEEIKKLKRFYNEITSSKFYKFWQTYCKYRDLLKEKIH